MGDLLVLDTSYFLTWRLSICFQVTDGLSDLKDVDRVSVYEAGKELANAAVKVLAQGLTMPDREVCTAGCF